MKVSVFTGNQSRHLALIRTLANAVDEVSVVHECNTIFPGKGKGNIRESLVMKEYFSLVIRAELDVFGPVGMLPDNVCQLALAYGDLSGIDMSLLESVLDADFFIVFGASYIKGPLANFLVENNAVNIHMGALPYYRGSSCNFWAIYDDNPDLVCGSVQRLGKGLDTGDILFHVAPKPREVEPMNLGMLATEATINALVDKLVSKELAELEPVRQDESFMIRYSKGAEFTDEIARKFLDQNITPAQFKQIMEDAPERKFERPVYF